MCDDARQFRMQVMWNRLISVVEEQALTLIRTAFSTSVREAGDLSAGVFDAARPDAGAGGHRHARPCQRHGRGGGALHPRDRAAAIFEGDVYITNDPWKGTGHLHDFTVVSPSFRRGRLIGFFACTAHVVDIGGRGFGPDAKRVYEEGIFIPIMKFAERGEVEPRPGHDRAQQCARARPGGRRHLFARGLQRDRPSAARGMMDEFGLDDLEQLGGLHPRAQPSRHAGEARGAAARALPQPHDARRLRRADQPERRARRSARPAPRRFRRHVRR